MRWEFSSRCITAQAMRAVLLAGATRQDRLPPAQADYRLWSVVPSCAQIIGESRTYVWYKQLVQGHSAARELLFVEVVD